MMNTNMNNYIPAGSSPGLTRAAGHPLSGTYIGCSVLHNVPARPTFSVYRCNRRRCATCAVIKPLRFFRSCLTNRRYTVISACDLSCSTTNVIYLISCAKCGQQYVGETKRKVSEQLSGYRSSIKKHANTFIARHFNSPGHTMDDIRIQPIEHITQNLRETEKDSTIRRLDRERFLMLELGTMYPYAFNDRLQHVGNVSHSSVRSRNNVFNLLIVINAVNGAMDSEVTQFTATTDSDMRIIKHACKSLRFHDGLPWVKRDSSNAFDVTMGSYDGVEIRELVGLFILSKLRYL